MATPALAVPQPLLIEAGGHTCMAWWHASAPAADPRGAPALPRGWLTGGALPLAVVLASSWGEEDLVAYDDLRALAVALAAAGIGVLRFEWPDTGDSSAASGASSMADALAAFDAAAGQARALSGCDRLAFVGLRLGALLAAQAAVARADVHALAALLPVASGRAFTREQRPHVSGSAAPVAAPPPGASFDPADLPVALGGFAQTVRGLEAMAALKWPQAVGASLREALLVGAPAHAAVDALVRAGVRVREWAHEGRARALDGAPDARLEPAAMAEVVRWLQERAADPGAAGARSATANAAGQRTPAADSGSTPLEAATGAVLALAALDARPWMRLQAGGVAVRECLVRIGDPRDREPPLLAGVLAEADLPAGAAARNAPRRAIVLLAAGGERRVGPHRLWVPWARERAARGDVVLRLDLPGIGDSERHPQADPERRPAPYDSRGVAAIERASAWLRGEHGVATVVVVGLCAGAWQAWQAALAGVGVQHVVAVDPPVFHWRPGVALPLDDPRGPAAGAPAAARAGLHGLGRALARRARHALRQRARAAARALRWPLEHDLAADLARVVARGVALDFVFSARAPGLARWREEAGRAGARLARDGRVTVREVAHADPGFAGTAGRVAFYACLDQLLQGVLVPLAAAARPGPTQPPALR